MTLIPYIKIVTAKTVTMTIDRPTTRFIKIKEIVRAEQPLAQNDQRWAPLLKTPLLSRGLRITAYPISTCMTVWGYPAGLSGRPALIPVPILGTFGASRRTLSVSSYRLLVLFSLAGPEHGRSHVGLDASDGQYPDVYALVCTTSLPVQGTGAPVLAFGV